MASIKTNLGDTIGASIFGKVDMRYRKSSERGNMDEGIGVIMNVSQILLILKEPSAKVNLPFAIIETLSYAITSAYSYRNNYPFSTYGENFFLTLQNIAILYLIIAYPPLRLQTRGRRLFATLVGAAALTAVLSYIPETILTLLQMTLSLSGLLMLSKIMKNARTQSTDQLSTFAVRYQIGRCLVRLFTTAIEVNDWILAVGFAVTLLLNIILGYQLYVYRPTSSTVEGANADIRGKTD